MTAKSTNLELSRTETMECYGEDHDFAVSGEREWTRSGTTALPQVTPLPGWDIKSQVSEISSSILGSYHLSMLFALADGFREKAINVAEPALANNLRNLRDLDVGVFSDITEYIGRGATFVVHRTAFPDSRNVVLKSRIPDETQDSRLVTTARLKALLLELRVLTHPPLRSHRNIVQLVQIGWQSDSFDMRLKWPVLIVDYADKGTLADLFENGIQLDFESKTSLFRDISEGLHALHACQIVHGDLKMENVLVCSTEDGALTAKLSDFGGALLDHGDDFQEPTGTPPWTAPEHLTRRTRQELLVSDVYALGLLFWRVAIDGRQPFEDPVFNLPTNRAETLAAIARMKMTDGFVQSIEEYLRVIFDGAEMALLKTLMENTVRVSPLDRSLDNVLAALRNSETSNAPTYVELTFFCPIKKMRGRKEERREREREL